MKTSENVVKYLFLDIFFEKKCFIAWFDNRVDLDLEENRNSHNISKNHGCDVMTVIHDTRNEYSVAIDITVLSNIYDDYISTLHISTKFVIFSYFGLNQCVTAPSASLQSSRITDNAYSDQFSLVSYFSRINMIVHISGINSLEMSLTK